MIRTAPPAFDATIARWMRKVATRSTESAPGEGSPRADSVDLAPARAPNDAAPSFALQRGLQARRPGDSQITLPHKNPQIGTAEPAPRIVAGPLRSPRFLGTEVEYFKEARRLVESARAGDMLCLQMYEFENAITNPKTPGAVDAPSYADQQALLPALADAAARGVKLNIVLDASKNPRTGELNNAPITRWLRQAAQKSGNITLDYYPPETVNIDHAKELLYFTTSDDGAYVLQEALTGGSNWGSHTPANDDGGAIFYGRDGMGAAQIFFRDQAFCRGDRSSPAAPQNDPNAPVQWAVTAPHAEGHGSSGILEAKLSLTREADAVFMNDYVLTHANLLRAVTDKGKNAHVRLCPTEQGVNIHAIRAIRRAGGEAMWANTQIDPQHMAGQKNHEKLDVYVRHGDGIAARRQEVAFALTMGSANDSANGLEPSSEDDIARSRRINHEIDSIVRRVTTDEITSDGSRYSTEAFLDAALAKTKNDLATRSCADPPTT